MNIELKYLIVEDSLKVCEGIVERVKQHTSQWTACPFAHHINDAKTIAAKEKPQLIFIDWSLKGGSAYEVLAFIESIPGYHPYIIFNTGYQSENPEIPQEIINNYKIDKYVIKPFWENFRNNLSTYLTEAENKIKTNTATRKVWLMDVNKRKAHIDLYKLTCICQQFENSYNKDFYFDDTSTITAKLSWQNIIELLKKNRVEFFVTNSRQHLIVKNYIESYQRPFVKLKSFPRKIEIVKEKLHEFEEWL